MFPRDNFKPQSFETPYSNYASILEEGGEAGQALVADTVNSSEEGLGLWDVYDHRTDTQEDYFVMSVYQAK